MRLSLRRVALTVLILLAPSGAFAQSADADRFDDAFRKYSKRYFSVAFDWRLFKAQAMVESNMRSRARSRAGARGIMQLMPSTFREIRSKNPEITGKWDQAEANIAAGIAYSRQLWTLWTADSHVDHLRQFMLSSYNAGRSTLLRAQTIARERALDARVWPSIEKVAPTVPNWRYDETLNYVARVFANLADMDPHGRIAP
jgi:membrane-bound lytic murein transglycosylase F